MAGKYWLGMARRVGCSARVRLSGLRISLSMAIICHARSSSSGGLCPWRVSRSGSSILIRVAGIGICPVGSRPEGQGNASPLEGDVEHWAGWFLGDTGIQSLRVLPQSPATDDFPGPPRRSDVTVGPVLAAPWGAGRSHWSREDPKGEVGERFQKTPSRCLIWRRV